MLHMIGVLIVKLAQLLGASLIDFVAWLIERAFGPPPIPGAP